ncbi:MAG: hypothetical protein PUC82_03345 [bacterium]|nr:hypothetical protein [bacterium]
MIIFCFLLLIFMSFIVFGIFYKKTNKKNYELDNNINEWSFQRYADFYGNMVLKDSFFYDKMNKIYDLIINEKEDDINFIAKEAGCTYEECILKIKYLKNKRQIGDMYIDKINGVIKKCSPEDQALLDKYTHFLYVDKFQIFDIARMLPQTSSKNINEVMQQVFEDLKYLDDKGLINGIILNEVDQTILYYSVEKHKKEKDFVTINCKNCGALNDVNRGSKVRCRYCNTIVAAPLNDDALK